MTRRRYHTRSQTRKMAKESDVRIEQLEKESQDQYGQLAEMIELLRTLVKEKGQASSPGPQNETAQHDQRSKEPVYPTEFTPPYALNVTWHKHHLCNKPEAFNMAMCLP